MPLDPSLFRIPRNYRIARLVELFAPVLRILARLRSGADATLPSTWRRGVIFGAGHIGDVLYNTASLRSLMEGLPDCRWHYVAESPASQVLAGNPCIEAIVDRATLGQAKAGFFDVAICYNSGMNWRDLLLAAKLGIPNRVGYADKGFSGLVTFPIAVERPQPYPAYFRSLVGQVTQKKPEWPLAPVVYPNQEDQAAADRIWRELNLDDTHPVVACFVTTRQPSGVWPASQFAEAIAAIEKEGSQTVLLGAAGDAELLAQLKQQFGLTAPVVAGRLGLLPLVCFLRRCALVLSTDSGPRHLANAAGTRVVYVRNIAVNAIETGSYCETEFDLAPQTDFVPPDEQGEWLSRVKPPEVAKQILSLLSAPAQANS